jgi:hypothetical protein
MNLSPLSSSSHVLFIEDILSTLLTLCRDPIGTVRVAAYQSLGEIITNDGLSLIMNFTKLVQQIEDPSDRKEVLSSQFQSKLDVENINAHVHDKQIHDIVMIIKVGCLDSKLAVRLQAMWSLGNLLLLILPARQQETFRQHIYPLLLLLWDLIRRQMMQTLSEFNRLLMFYRVFLSRSL